MKRPPTLTLADAMAELQVQLTQGTRLLLGVVGAPGAGKSTLAARLHAHFGEISQIVPMDGFHLAQAQLERLGRAQRKGAPDTFDSAGYVALLERLHRQRADEIIYAPDYRREIEEPVAGAIAIAPQMQLLICEGNYLLLDEDHWARVAGLLHASWYVQVDDALRLQRLQARHERYGRSAVSAQQWIAQTDEPNARKIEATRERATQVVVVG